MIRFLAGLILGAVVGAVALSVTAVLNPLAEGPISRMATAVPSAQEDVPSAPPEAPAEPEAANAPETTAPEATEAPAVEPAAPTASDSAGAGPTVAPAAPATQAPVPEGPALSAPAIADSAGAGLPGATDSSPSRTPSAPQRVAVAAPSTDGGASLDTQSASVPEIGGAELETSTESDLGPVPDLVEGDALADNSLPFQLDGSRPIMSIILIDEGGNTDLRAGLAALTAPITFGVTADIDEAADVAAQYRNSGFELVAVMPETGPLALQSDSEESDVADVLARVFDAVPQAATLLDPIDSPLPQNRRMAGALLETLKLTGHGLLTHRGNGLNNIPIIADQEGVPSELIYRVIDEVSGSANIALALERAVLDASRGGSVIVVGRVRQETVTTLFSWLLGSGAKEVSIAPVSAILQRRLR